MRREDNPHHGLITGSLILALLLLAILYAKYCG